MKKITIFIIMALFIQNMNAFALSMESVEKCFAVPHKSFTNYNTVHDGVQENIYDFEWLLDEYFNIRESDFKKTYSDINENLFSETVVDEVVERRHLMTINEGIANIKFVNANVDYFVNDIKDNGQEITVYVYEWTLFDYDDLSDYQYIVDQSGFGTNHVIILQKKNNSYVIIDDAYDESDITGMTSNSYDRYFLNNNYDINENEEIANPCNYDSGIELFSMINYDADKAVAYANKYWDNYNKNYSNYNSVGGDCANFVSQCLHAGGFKMDSNWYWKSYNNKSSSWTYCPSQKTYFSKKGKFIEKATANQILKGNPVWYYNKNKKRYSHAAICVGTNSAGTPIVNAHNNDRYHVTWTLGGSKYGWGYYSTVQLNSQSKPAKPSITSFEARSTSSVKISWKAVSGATKYRVDRRRKDEENYKTVASNLTGTSYTDSGLSAGKLYYYRVYAINGAGTSPRSETYATYTRPGTPKAPTVNRDSQSQLTVSWSKVSGATHYKVLCRKAGEKDYKVVANNLTGTSYVHKGLQAGTQYCYRVVAVVKASLGEEGKRKTVSVESGQSDTKSKFTTAKRPSNTVDNDNPTYTILKWDKAVGDDSGFTYEIWRNGKRIGTTKNTEYTDKTGTSGTVYEYEIKINGSSWTTGKFYAGPKMTSKTTVTPESATSVRISWNKPNGGSNLKYRVKKWNGKEYVDLGDTTNTYYVDKGLKTGEFYKYYVQVRDKNGNYITSNINGSSTLQILPTKIALNKTGATLNEGDTLTLTASITPGSSTNKSVTWTSSNANAVTVNSNGAVTAKAAGTATITAKTANGLTASCTITVKPKVCVHEYGGWITEKDATCTEDGSRCRVCAKCGEGRETEVIPAAGHTFAEEWTVTKEPTCTEPGEQVHVCTVCGVQSEATAIDALGHTFPEEWTQESAATCTEAGIERRACTICGEKEERSTEYAEHAYELTAQTDPTLTGPGSRTYTCSICGISYSEEYVPFLEEGVIDVGGIAASAGQTVTIPVSISENPGIAGFNFVLKYDSSVLTPTAITKGSMLSSGTFETNLNEGIPASELEDVAVYWGDATNITGNGELFSVTFKIDGNAPDGIYEVALEYEKGDVTDQTYNDVMPDVHTNIIQVADVLKGDINLDGNVDPMDSVLMAKVLAHYKIELTEKQKDAANVFNDKEKKINTKDAVSLAQLIAGWENPVLQSEGYVALLEEAATPKIAVEAFEASAGEYIDIPVTISDNPGIAGFNFVLNYDKAKLTPVAIEKSEMLTDGNFASNLEETGDGAELENITASWSDTDPITENGALFNVMFVVNDNVTVGETVPVEISYEADDVCDRYLNSIAPTVEQGKIDIIEFTEEDTGDDVVTEVMPYYVNDVYMQLSDGTATDDIPKYGNFDLQVGIESAEEEYTPAVMLTAAYDESGKLISIQQTEITEDVLTNGVCTAHIPESAVPIHEVDVFFWDSMTGMKPVADTIHFQK